MPNDIQQLRRVIEGFLAQANIPFQDRGNRISVRRGSSAVFITPKTWAEQHTVVELLSPVLSNIERTPALLERLNELNMSLYFGKAYWHDHGIWIAHNLLGDHVDRDELIAAVGILATATDKLDDELKGAFGGVRWIDS